jgi:hypothetical protein
LSKTGYCSLCKNPKVMLLNNAIKAGKGYTVVMRELESEGFSMSKVTFLKHKAHLTSPLITAAEAARKANPVSNRAVLEAIRDLGMQKALDNPDDVKIDHALRAAKILQDAEGKQESVLVVLAKAVMGPPPEMIEAEYKILETSEVSD